ncbi:SIMPL domain-containing protein [Endozoicomonas sp. SCSIO W0465]|uniref:SIMPL domain-containing protein n=1 Tax=Endozoicomonas sp. SCSIO W0465 TaxID=2918516 RepID=UPI0020760B1A|nr:SIMPL domain-containing protein [Endozoicomonas sp. SCSIO W0465]USE39356.1 SIMPL domain-containing protein [Endozoicomonas sp. SCSIO W0465]
MSTGRVSALILGISVFLGLSCLGYLLANAAIDYKLYERSVTVKGLSEREYQADVVIWPIQFSAADNDLKTLYRTIENNTDRIRAFLEKSGIAVDEISLMSPDITDKSANQYGNSSRPEFRYTALQTITVYSGNIDAVRSVMGKLSDLGRDGIVFTGGNYGSQPEYLFTRLNDVKPEMIEEATRKAREVAGKFASDSRSELGKIKRASQGQFSISNRDRNNPHIKKVRVVATIEYYLSD